MDRYRYFGRAVSDYLVRENLPSRNWFGMLADLHRVGICNADVARLLNCPRSTVAKWKAGAEPNFYYGNLLITLHVHNCAFVPSGVPLLTTATL